MSLAGRQALANLCTGQIGDPWPLRLYELRCVGISLVRRARDVSQLPSFIQRFSRLVMSFLWQSYQVLRQEQIEMKQLIKCIDNISTILMYLQSAVWRVLLRQARASASNPEQLLDSIEFQNSLNSLLWGRLAEEMWLRAGPFAAGP